MDFQKYVDDYRFDSHKLKSSVSKIVDLWEQVRSKRNLSSDFSLMTAKSGKYRYYCIVNKYGPIHEPMQAYPFWALLTGSIGAIFEED